jgi:hypothetical protein
MAKLAWVALNLGLPFLDCTDHAGDPGPGLELVRDQVNTVCDFHALLTVAGVAEGAPHVCAVPPRSGRPQALSYYIAQSYLHLAS